MYVHSYKCTTINSLFGHRLRCTFTSRFIRNSIANATLIVQAWMWLAARDTHRIDSNSSILSYSITRRRVAASQPPKMLYTLHVDDSSLYHNHESSTCCPQQWVNHLLYPKMGQLITQRWVIYMQDPNDASPT